MRVVFISTALALLACAGCALAPYVPRSQLEGWYAVEAAGVSILGDIPPAELRGLADDLALFDAAFALLTRGSAGAAAGPITVFLLRDRDLARRFHLGHGIAGWALPTLDGDFAAVEFRDDPGGTRSTLFHEYTHLLLRRNRRAPVPPWYDEGLASVFGTLQLRDGALVVGAVRQAAITRLVSEGPLSLEELFEGDVWSHGAAFAHDFYATSWALSHYLLLSPRGRREMSRLVELLAAGVDPAQAQRRAFGRPPEALETELRVHIAHLARGTPAEVVMGVETLAVQASATPAPLARSDTACALGRLAVELASVDREASERALARRLLEMAAADGPTSARCEAGLAQARALGGDVRGAQAPLDRALGRAPDDPLVAVLAGRTELVRADAGDDEAAAAARTAAEAHFRRALAGDRRSAAAWFGLGQSLTRANRPTEALSAFETARRHGWSPALDLALGELLIALGRGERAFALLWPLVQDPHGGPTREEAGDLLEAAGLLPAQTVDANP